MWLVDLVGDEIKRGWMRNRLRTIVREVTRKELPKENFRLSGFFTSEEYTNFINRVREFYGISRYRKVEPGCCLWGAETIEDLVYAVTYNTFGIPVGKAEEEFMLERRKREEQKELSDYIECIYAGF